MFRRTSQIREPGRYECTFGFGLILRPGVGPTRDGGGAFALAHVPPPSSYASVLTSSGCSETTAGRPRSMAAAAIPPTTATSAAPMKAAE